MDDEFYIVVSPAQIDKATQFLGFLNKLLDYPKYGVNVGRGRHVPAEQSRTLRHTWYITHPTDGRVAIRRDATVRWLRNHEDLLRAKLTDNQITQLKAAIDGAEALTADWFPELTP